jgi:hypothetical protein
VPTPVFARTGMRFPFLGAPNKIEKSPLLCVFLDYLNIHASERAGNLLCAPCRPFVCVNLLFTLSSPLRERRRRLTLREVSYLSAAALWVRLVMSACVVFNVFIVFEVEGRVKVEPPR